MVTFWCIQRGHSVLSLSLYPFPSQSLTVLGSSHSTAPCAPEQGSCWRPVLPTTTWDLFCALSFICSSQPLCQFCVVQYYCFVSFLALLLLAFPKQQATTVLAGLYCWALPAHEIRISVRPSSSNDCLQVLKGSKEKSVSVQDLFVLLALIEKSYLSMSYKLKQVLNQNHVLVVRSEVQEHLGGDGRAMGEP